MLKPIALIETHMECRFLKETIPVLTDLLAFEIVSEEDGQVSVKHPNTDWLLIVHEGGPAAPDKQMLNHYGVRVASRKEVDAAHEYLTAHQAEYGLHQIGRPSYSHGSYSLYFLEPGTNGWEIECYEDALKKGKEWEHLGSVYAPHWERPLPPERFSGRGYVPQAFTHGTLACGEKSVSACFYTEVLGLDIFHPNNRAMYLKAPKTKCYVVSAIRESWKRFSPNFCFTLSVESAEAVTEAHRWLADTGQDLGVTGLGELRGNGAVSFFVSDPDGNWWEITSRTAR